MSKEKGVEALDRYIRRLSSHPNADIYKGQQVEINISDDDKKFSVRSLCCCSKKNAGTEQSDIDVAKEVNITEHLMSVTELEFKFRTNADEGLTQEEAGIRLKKDGPNAFTPPKQKSNWMILLKELTAGFAGIMWLTAIASCVVFAIEKKMTDIYLAIFISVVLVATALYSFKQQRSSGKIFESFKNMIPQQTLVIRDGKQKKVPADQLVVGDIVLCKGGERIPADVRILKCEGMKVDNSSLTGEAEPLSRSPEAGHQMPLEAKNIAFFSTSCIDGSGVGMVIATGDNTVMGKIAKLVTNIRTNDSPITIEISRFVNIIGILSIAEGIVYFAICMALKIDIFESFIFMISIIVGNIPEGLLPAMTLGLTLTAKRLAQKKCLIKYLEAVETLGSTSTICSDKTGTLTENRMTVEHCYLGNRIVHVSHDKDEFKEDIEGLEACWDAYERCAKLCSRATFASFDDDVLKRECSGDASESAILRFMESVTPVVEEYRDRFPKVAEKPFSSVYKYQFSVHRYNREEGKEKGSGDPNFFVVLKGAPERIIALCSSILNVNGKTVPMSDADIEAFETAYRELGSMGERVLAFCDMDLQGFAPDHQFNLDEEGKDFEVNHFRFLGLVALIDPPRASVPDAVAKCKEAGITVIMVTGDHPITAQAIAKSVGIISVSHRRSTQISLPRIDKKYNPMRKNFASIVVPGDELSTLSDEELRTILRDFNEIVFARTSPQQKLRIVENCQKLDRIVAVTGDGVNDSPALKKADIGVAMGITGSDVSKQAADMILMDDNFASIVVGVEEGRKIFDNLKKIISYILTGNISTLWPFVFFIAFGIPVAISPIMMLVVTLGTDLVPAISLAYEKAESDIMKLSPRNPKRDRLVTRSLLLWAFFQGGLIVTAGGFLGYFSTLMDEGWMPWNLFDMREHWEDVNMNLTDFYNHTWTYEERMEIMPSAQSSYFAGVVVVQVADVIVHKTRRVSLIKQGFGNFFLNFSIFLELALACFLIYTPVISTALSFGPVPYKAWLIGIPMAVYLLIFEEVRKLFVRWRPNSFIGQELCK